MNDARVWVLVPAAGVGSRMQSDTPKQYLPLNGKPVLSHTLALLQHTPGLQGIVVAVSESDVHFGQLPEAHSALVHRVEGGRERADSVQAGLRYLNKHAQPGDWVLVHDAARPCLSLSLLAKFVQTTVAESRGAILALPVADTLKQVQAGAIVDTVDRSALWGAQTPQLFPLEKLRQSLDAALAAGVRITDEASAMEHAGFPVAVFEGEATNLKITRPQDLALAALILRAQQESV